MKSKTSKSKKTTKTVDYSLETLDNGIRVLTVEDKSIESVFVELMVLGRILTLTQVRIILGITLEARLSIWSLMLNYCPICYCTASWIRKKSSAKRV